MSPFSKQKFEQIRNDRKQQIKDIALRIFARQGFTGTKTSMIAFEAGISEGLIYRYYKSKEELFTEIVQELIEEAESSFNNLHSLPGTPFEQIRLLTQGMLDKNNKFAFMLILRARKDENIPDKAKQHLKQHSPNTLLDQLIPIYIKGQEAGEFSQGNPSRQLSWYFYIINSLIMQEVWDEEYEMPDVNILMRFLTK